MAQTSLVKKRPPPPFSDPAKARSAGAHGNIKKANAPEFVALRRQQVIDLKVRGFTNAQLAEHFGVSEATIVRDVAVIRRDGLIEKWERKFVGALMQKAVEKIGRSLAKDDGNLEDVKEIFKRFDSLAQRKHEVEQLDRQAPEEDSLEGWFRKWAAAKAEPTTPPDAIDTELVGPVSDHPEQVSDGQDYSTPVGTAPVTCSEPAPASDAPASESGPDPERPGGPESVEHSAQTSPPTGADASQGGLASGEAEGAGPIEHDPNRLGAETSD